MSLENPTRTGGWADRLDEEPTVLRVALAEY